MRYLILAFGFVSTIALAAEESIDAKIARAMSAAPDHVSNAAKIVDVDGTVLRDGANGWVCSPGVVPGDDHPMCNDAVWGNFMASFAAGEQVRGNKIGVSYMLQGDMYVSNADPSATDPNNGHAWVQEGPHIMIWVPKYLLEGMTRDPFEGGPYVMWSDTPYAHIMVPIGEKLVP